MVRFRLYFESRAGFASGSIVVCMYGLLYKAIIRQAIHTRDRRDY